MHFAPPAPLSNLSPFVLSDHALKLQEKLVLWCACLRSTQKLYFDPMPGKLLQE
jgi:hypothetical protein